MPPPPPHTHTHFLVCSPYWHVPSHKNDHLLKCAVSQSETEKYFERIIIALIIDVSREKKDKQNGPCYFHDPSAWDKKTISYCRKWSLLNGNTISGSSGGLQPVKKGKTPLPPSGIPDPKHPRLSKDEGKACVCYPYYVTLRCMMRTSFSHIP